MIGRLTGIVAEKSSPNHAIIDVHGVGYNVELPMSSFCLLPAIGGEVVLHIQHILREDASILYGFMSKEEREAFRILIKVTGIGPKSAIVILSGLTASELYHVVQAEDINQLTKVPGIGKKTAERLILELRDKIDVLAGSESLMNAGKEDLFAPPVDASDDAVLALVALGYNQTNAQKMVKAVAKEEMGASVDTLVRKALQNIMRSK